MATVWRTPCAFARLFVGKTGQILNNAIDLGPKLAPQSLSVIVEVFVADIPGGACYDPKRAVLEDLESVDVGRGGVCESDAGVFCNSKKYSTYGKSPQISTIAEQYEYETVKNPPEWTYVQRLLPFDVIPEVKPKEAYPSGWIPPKEEAKNLPYFIERNKNHNLPIHLDLTFRGNRKISKIKKIEGDIWMLNDEIKAFLKNKYNKYIETRVHELARSIEVKGDYVVDLMDWAHSKGF